MAFEDETGIGSFAVDIAGWAGHMNPYQKLHLENLKALIQCQEVRWSKPKSKWLECQKYLFQRGLHHFSLSRSYIEKGFRKKKWSASIRSRKVADLWLIGRMRWKNIRSMLMEKILVIYRWERDTATADWRIVLLRLGTMGWICPPQAETSRSPHLLNESMENWEMSTSAY